MKSAEELIALSGALSLAISKAYPDVHDLTAFIEFFGLMRHNLDLIRHRRIAIKAMPMPIPHHRPIFKRRMPLSRKIII